MPDPLTFSKNRHGRFRDSDVPRRLFEATAERCIAECLVGGDGFAVHASLIKADANRQRSVPGSEVVPPRVSQPVREYLAVLDDAAFGASTPVVPKFISIADPASRWTGANGGLAFFAYSTNYLIERTQDRFGVWPQRLAADTAYGTGENLAWLVHDRGIEPHIPVFDKSARENGTFDRRASEEFRRESINPPRYIYSLPY